MRSILLASLACSCAALGDFQSDAEDLFLLQVRAEKHDQNHTVMGEPPSSKGAFDSCYDFGGTADIIGRNVFTPDSSNFDFCRCWGDTHCDHVPFEYRKKKGTEKLGLGHYQFDGPGASTYAKAADGSWEIQIFQCGLFNFHPSSIRGAAIKVGEDVVQYANANGDAVCYVNGERKEPGHEVNLPTGFHFRCPAANTESFCAVKDGEFAAMTMPLKWGLNQVLAVPKTVDVQEANTVCYDTSSQNNAEIKFGREISNTAIVPIAEMLFSQPVLDFLGTHETRWGQCYLPETPQSQPPLGTAIDPQTLCNDRGADAWEHAEAACAHLKQKHWRFYDDCLVEDCIGPDEEEEDVIDLIAEVDEPEDEAPAVDDSAAVGDPHLSGPGVKGDLCCEGGHCSRCQ